VRTEKRIIRGEVRAVGMLERPCVCLVSPLATTIPPSFSKVEPPSKKFSSPEPSAKRFTPNRTPAFLINHDPNKLFGRVSSGTLRLQDTSEGLSFECDFPDTQAARDAYASIQRGDMHGCSFKFGTDTGDDEWSIENDTERGRKVAVRKIRNVSVLDDVSAVTFPAYPNTSV
jgi:HK97 family phage prohead protease